MLSITDKQRVEVMLAPGHPSMAAFHRIIAYADELRAERDSALEQAENATKYAVDSTEQMHTALLRVEEWKIRAEDAQAVISAARAIDERWEWAEGGKFWTTNDSDLIRQIEALRAALADHDAKYPRPT